MTTVPTYIFFRHGQAEHNVAAEVMGDAAYLDPKYNLHVTS
jgi:broad specificity phosphatase PhoE